MLTTSRRSAAYRSEQRRRKKIGRLLSTGIPFNEALAMEESGSSVRMAKPSKVRHRGVTRALSGLEELRTSLRETDEMLELISSMLTLLGVLGILGTFGFGMIGLLAVTVYVAFWELIAEMFASVERRMPKPVRVPWRLLRRWLETFVG